MNKITLKSPSGVVMSTKDMHTARALLALGWQPVEMKVVTKAEVKK